MRYYVMCKVYTGYCGTSEIEHGLCACTVDNPLAKARGLSLRTGAQPMLYLPLIIELQTCFKSCQSNSLEQQSAKRLLTPVFTQRNHMLEVSVFNGAGPGVCTVMTKLSSLAHCLKSKHHIGEYISDTAPCIIHATKT